MTHDFCPLTITLDDGTKCERYDTWTDSYFCGLVAVEICNYRCPDKKVHSRWQLKVLGIEIGPEGGRTYDPDNPTPLPPGHRCLQEIQPGGADCQLSESWTIKFLGGLMRVEVCIYKCYDCVFYVSRWQTSFFGIPLPWRERATFPYPI